VALHSDYLHLQIKQDGSVWSKTTFNDSDILMEVRGSVVKHQELVEHLQRLGRTAKAYDGLYGTLLWVNFSLGLLIKPQGISQNLITASLLKYKPNGI
jgi:hypothetical protein